MPVTADIAPVIAAWPPPSFLRLPAAGAASRGETATSMARIESQIDKDFAETKGAAENLLAQIAQLKITIGSLGLLATDLEDAILKLEDSERRVQRDTRIKKYVQQARRSVVPHGRDLVARFDRAMERFFELRRLVLVTLREARWELMAIDAMRLGDFTGTAFDDPKALRRYLAKHTH